MSIKTRKHMRAVSLVMSIAIVGVLAAFLVLASNPGPTQAQDDRCATASGDALELLRELGLCTAPADTSDTAQDDECATASGDALELLRELGLCTAGGTDATAAGNMITSDSSSGGGAPEFQVVIESLPTSLAVGSSIVLYLEDDYQEPATIPASSVYFVAESPTSEETGNGARVYTTIAPKVDNDAYFDADKSDISIRVFIPDMCTSSTDDCQGPNGVDAGQKLTMVVEDGSGIKNPTEAGSHSAAFKILGPTDSVPGPAAVNKDFELKTVAKIALSDVDNIRSYELTVTGSGFNNGTTATAWVLGRAPTTAEWWDVLDCGEMKGAVMGKTPPPVDANTDGMGYCNLYSGLDSVRQAVVGDLDTTAGYPEMGVCRVIIDKGTAAGSNLVGSNDKVDVSFEVTVPTFSAGTNNYICMNDGEDRQSDTDVEDFNLEPSIRVVPSTVSSGDTVNVFAQDYPFSGQALTQLKLAGIDVTGAVANLTTDSLVNGGATISFEVPGSVNGAPLQGTVRLDARWGSPGSDGKCNVDADSNCTSKDSKITVTGSELTASVTDVLPNETITITGNGYGSQTCIGVDNIQLDGVALQVDEESTIRCDVDGDGDDEEAVEVSNSGQFVASITIWPAVRTSDNPSLISGSHTLDVEDSAGFVGSTTLMIAEPTISVVPDVVGPRDYVVITGTNWPIDNSDNSNSGLVSIVISDDRNERTYSVYPDNIGRFSVEHRVSKDVAIPSTNQVKGSHSEVVKIGSFTVPAATVMVTPNQAQPGDTVSLSATDMKPYAEADYVKVGGTAYNDPGANTDIDGNITIGDVLVPGLDPGTYSVIINVDGTVAIGELEVLAEDSAAGSGAELPGALEELGDSLVRVFHFNGVDKSWDFYDPRPDFADLNTLTTVVNGEPYWVLVSDGQEDVVLNNRARTLTCVGGDCWNQIVW